ncbi:hypothetical protein [Terribacillus saccharophilus]|uniref:hypothetical protein n=1 Tax=Terribacillus saccharophilus TaxID=361277 RepID=UPI002989CCDA|nr:hypothetical protein [Terribacillus saccharophilus]MCM3224234.1 hypothetical protein [Terribacillus saccharophilus]
MKKIIPILLLIVFVFSLQSPLTANAEENSNIDSEALYRKAIKEGVISEADLSLEDWLTENEQYKKIYDDGVKDNVFESPITYEEWLKLNNYGQEPKDVNDGEVTTFKIQAKSTFKVKPGDIFITNGTFASGIIGHAAIANGANHILDMPGYGDKSDNNRQLTVSQWLSKYKSKGWIKVYRIKDSKLAAQVARYADTHYWSTKGAATKNIHIAYKITPHLYTKSPSYCSKLVFDAYWYGTGSKKVMGASKGFVPPYGLISQFNPGWGPSKVHTY